MIALRRHAGRATALVIVLGLYGIARLPSLGEAERSTLVSRFGFEAYLLPQTGANLDRSLREVHPSLKTHAGWVSTVGAAVALADLDHDGLPNDLIYVEVRSDELIVTPVPGTGERYETFTLDPAPLDQPTWAPMGAVTADINEDGRLDVLVYYWGRPPVAFLRRSDVPTMDASSFHAVELMDPSVRWFTNAATFADIDGDGHLDLVVGNYFQDGGHILDAHGSGTEQMHDSMSRAFNGGTNHILLWTAATTGSNPSVTMTEAADVFADDIARGWTLGVAAGDLDGDLLPELYFANDFGPDRLLHNRSMPGAVSFALLAGRKTLNVPNSKVLGRDSFKGMGVDLGDVNGDGTFDIYVSNIADEYALQESHFLWTSNGPAEQMRAEMMEGIAPYVDRSEPLGLSRSGWGWESRLADFDNDGTLEAIQATGFLKGEIDRWPELHELAMGNDRLVHLASSWPSLADGDDLSGHQHNPFFVRSASGCYYDLAPELGLDAPFVTRGIATADVDGDGRLDFAIANQWEDSYFYRNRGAGGAFLGLNLLIPIGDAPGAIHPGHPSRADGGRPAIGATVMVEHPDGRTIIGHVDGGNGHSGARSHQVHFGLGDIRAAASVTGVIKWRNARGVIESASFDLSPGWHTVLLGSNGEDDIAGKQP